MIPYPGSTTTDMTHDHHPLKSWYHVLRNLSSRSSAGLAHSLLAKLWRTFRTANCLELPAMGLLVSITN